MRKSQVVLGNHGVFDLSRTDLGYGYHYTSIPQPGTYLSLAIFRRVGYRRLQQRGLFRRDSYYDVYINLNERTYTIGGVATSMLRWAHGKFFQLFSRGDAKVVGSYLVLAKWTPEVVSWHQLSTDLPITTLRHTHDFHPDKPVRALLAFWEDFFPPTDVEPFAYFDFKPWRVAVAEVEVR